MEQCYKFKYFRRFLECRELIVGPTGQARRSASSSYYTIQQVTGCHLLGGLLLLLLLLLSISLILLCGWCFFNNRCRLFSLGFLLDGNEKANDILGLDHVIFINLKFTEDVVNFSLGHLVSQVIRAWVNILESILPSWS
eukprot:TRINITY_DN185_c0_g1_i2.p1 TRINITY_DN185_c0_g1~~TRINITY_DN185_c0_g1_i2.p1  ORF type:complete len:139 (+),score=24.25 TRINITY_DN185_c0_g1_i2:111-527(+)